MPEHRVPRETLHEDLRAIFHDGEKVHSIIPDGDSHYRVFTVYIGQPLETRPDPRPVEAFVKFTGPLVPDDAA